MTAATDSITVQTPSRRAAAAEPVQAGRRGDLLLYLLLPLLLGTAWAVAQAGWFDDDDTNYWIGVAGASMMLALFAYPLRKYARFMQRLGRVKWWFWLHLSFGLAGPWLILVHSGFRVGSLNAGVALYSMLTVVASGVVGRFIHVRVHRGLNGERMSLTQLRERAGLVESDARSRLHFAPLVEARLLAFEQSALERSGGAAALLQPLVALPWRRWQARRHCRAELRQRLQHLAIGLQWDEDDIDRRERRGRRLVDRYLDAVVRVAQYGAYERLFALWHVAHLPFVYLLVISALVHVVAVHAY